MFKLLFISFLLHQGNPVPADAGIIVDNNDKFWYVEAAPYYEYLVLYSDTTDNAQVRIVDVYDLDVHCRLLSKKRDISFLIDDKDFKGWVWEFTLQPHEYHTLFPQQ
jgi:hypothetical protein